MVGAAKEVEIDLEAKRVLFCKKSSKTKKGNFQKYLPTNRFFTDLSEIKSEKNFELTKFLQLFLHQFIGNRIIEGAEGGFNDVFRNSDC